MTDDAIQRASFPCRATDVDWPTVSVCLAAGDLKQRHVGMCDESAQGHRILHLAWHRQLTDEAAATGSFTLGIRTRLPEARQRQVVARCSLVRDSNGRFIPYGFSFPGDVFDERTGKLL